MEMRKLEMRKMRERERKGIWERWYRQEVKKLINKLPLDLSHSPTFSSHQCAVGYCQYAGSTQVVDTNMKYLINYYDSVCYTMQGF